MKENRENPADLDLDRVLAQMAQEAPDMPADFHGRWTERIREEAAGSRQTESGREKKRQWRYLLSAAAVFVFLIGGTLLTRSMRTADLTAPIAVNEDTVSFSTAYEEAESAAPAETETAMEEAAEAPVMMNAAARPAESRKSASSAAREAEADFAAEAAAPADTEADFAAEEAVPEEPAPAPTAAPTPVATATAFPVPTVSAAPAETAEAAGETGGFVSFLEDFGLFTLKTLAAAAVIAAAVFGGLALRRAARKRK